MSIILQHFWLANQWNAAPPVEKTASDSLTTSATDETVSKVTPPASNFVRVIDQQARTTSVASDTTTLTEGVPVGHTVIVVHGGAGADNDVTVTDSKGNTWTNQVFVNNSNTSMTVSSSKITTALVAGDTITVTTINAVANGYTLWLHYKDLDAPILTAQATATAAAATTNPNAGPISMTSGATYIGFIETSLGGGILNPATVADTAWLSRGSGESGTNTKKWYGVWSYEALEAESRNIQGSLTTGGAWGAAIAGFTSTAVTTPVSQAQSLHNWVSSQERGSVRVRSKVTGTNSVGFAVYLDGLFEKEATPQAPDADGYVDFTVTGLADNTEYEYQLYDNSIIPERPDFGILGRFKTMPTPGAASNFRIALGACSQTNSVYGEAIQDLTAWAPDFLLHTGDFHYKGLTSTDPAVHRKGYEDQIANSVGFKDFVAKVPMFLLRSDHEAGPDNGDSNTTYNRAAIDGLKQIFPFGQNTLGDQAAQPSALYQTWVYGRVRFIQVDVRSMDRSPGSNADNASKTMLGATQKAWLKTQLLQPEPVKVIVSDVPWMGAADIVAKPDAWWSYSTERQEISDFINANGVKVILMHGDSHTLATATGTKNTWGNFPVWCAAPFHSPGGGRNLTTFDQYWNANAADGGPPRQYARITITDTGNAITFQFSGWDAYSSVERIAATETFVTPVLKTASDTLAASVTDTRQALVLSPSASDSVGASLTETATTFKAIVASDALSASATDSSTSFRTIVASDGLSANVVESSQFSTVSVSASDGLTSSVLDTSALLGSSTIPGIETLSASLTESSQTFVSLASSDTIASSLSEAYQFSTVVRTSSDTIAASVTDQAPSTSVSVQTSDSLSASASETSAATKSIVASDTLASSFSESTALTKSIVGSDSLSTNITEAASFGAINIVATDDLDVLVIDTSTTLGSNTVPGVETLTTSITEASVVEVSFDSDDTISAGLTEANTSLKTLVATDTLSASLAENRANFKTTISSDSLSASVTESQTSFKTIVASDSVSARIVDSSAQFVTVSSTDALAASTTESFEFATVVRSASDDLTATLVDNSSTLGNNTVPGQEDLSASVFESSETFVTVSVNDAFGSGLTESTSSYRTIPVSDTFAPRVTDTSTTFTSSSRSDSVTTSLTEAQTSYKTLVASDTVSSSTTEVSSSFRTLAANDSLTSSATEQSVFSTVNVVGSDDLSVTTVETSATLGDDTLPGYEDLNASIFESAETFVTVSSDDDLVSTLSEARQFSTVVVSGSDTFSTSIAEGTSNSFISSARADSLSTSVTDSSTAFKALVASDTAAASVTESSQFSTVVRSSSDTLSASVLDTSTTLGSNTVPGMESLSATLVENSDTFVTLSSQDTISAGLAEAYQFSTVNVQGSDTVSVSTTDNSQERFVTSSRPDTLSVSVVESAATSVSSTRPDSLSVSISEASLTAKSLVSSDGLAVSATEASVFSTVNVTGTDSLSVTALEENSMLGADTIPGSESLAPSLFESSQTFVTLAGSDSVDPTFTESYSFATVAVTSSDTLSVNTADTTQSTSVSSTATETVSARIVESTATFKTIVASDIVRASVTEAHHIFNQGVRGADSLAPSTTESSAFGQVAASGTDSLVITSVEHSEILGDDTLPGQENVNASLYESAETFVTLASSDDLSVSLSEAFAFAPVWRPVNDTAFASISESQSMYIALTASDSLRASVTETNSSFTTNNRPDSLAASATEISAARKNMVASDTLSSSITETYSFETFNITGSDTLTVGVVEADYAGLDANVPGHETLGVATFESSETVVYVSSQDTLRAKIVESSKTYGTVESQDSLTVALTEIPLGSVKAQASDSLGIVLEVESLTEVTSSARDILDTRFSDSVSVFKEDAPITHHLITGSDELRLIVSDEAVVEPTSPQIIYTWVEGKWRRGLVRVWDGKQWVIPSVKIYTSNGEWRQV